LSVVSPEASGSVVSYRLLVPNPADSEVTIVYEAMPINSTISIYDLMGRKLNTHQVDSTTNNWVVPTNSYPSGIYIVVARHQDAIIKQEKLVIK
jgi:Secretion system C-terminal sorting domain